MARVRFGDVVKEIKTNIDRATDNHEFYIAGEHMETENIHLTKRGRFEGSDVGPAFIRLFRPGQVLYGSRRTYLKKVAVADFEGITSNTTFVLETKDQNVMMQELLPFIMLTDSFTEYAIRNSKGSTNPYILFSDLCAYEFELPAIEEQRILTKRLLACDNVKEAYKHLIASTDELVKSQFIEMFGISETGETEWPEYKLQKLLDMGWITYHLDGNHGSEYPRAHEFVESGVPYISANCVIDGRIDFANAKYVTEARAKRFRKGIAENKDVLFAHNATVGPVAILETTEPQVILGTSLTAFRCNTEHILPEFLKAYLGCPRFVRQYEAEMQQSTRKQVPITTQRKYTIVVPDIDRQKAITRFMEQSDKSKFAAQQALADLTATQKALMRQYLG